MVLFVPLVVTDLEGCVENWPTRFRAEECITHLAGVKGVWNRLDVGPINVVDALEVREAIEQALERQAAERARHIHVEVHEGTVILTGRIRSAAEKEAVSQSVCHAFNIRSVENRLEIDPDL